MSTSELETRRGGGGTVDPLPATSQVEGCTPTARVFIDSIEVPTVNGEEESDPPAVEVRQVKTGPADITRAAEVTVPYDWSGTDVLERVTESADEDGFRAFGNDPVRIDILDEATDEYVTVHHGPISNVGPSTVSGAFKLFVTDWANYFENVHVSLDKREVIPRDILSEVSQELGDHSGLPQFEIGGDIGSTTDTNDFGGRGMMTAEEIEAQRTKESVDPLPMDADKEFERYKHTCVDILDWLCEKRGGRWFVEYNPSTNRPRIMFDTQLVGPRIVNSFDLTDRSLSAHDLAANGLGTNDVRVLENNALFQISPQHTLGARSQRVGGYVTEVIAEHERLTELAGENQRPEIKEIDAKNRTELVNEAKSRLKSRIDDAAGGEMVALPSPLARPYATIEAQPACNGRLDHDLPSVTYEIEEVIHKIQSPTQADPTGPRTIIRCGIECTMEDIEVRSVNRIEV